MNIRTMKDLLENLEGLGYSESTINQIRPRIKECPKFYNNAPLGRISADLEDFERRWGRGRIGAIAAGFKSHDHFVEWRKRVRGALGKAAGPQAPVAVLPDWTILADYVVANGGIGRPIGPHRQRGILTIAEVATADGLGPPDVVPGWVTPAASKLSGKPRRTFKRGITTMNDLIATRADHPEIDQLLPHTPLPQPDRGKSPPSPWRRGHRPQASALWFEFDQFVLAKRGTDGLGRPIPAEKSELWRVNLSETPATIRMRFYVAASVTLSS